MTIKDCIDLVDNLKPNQYTIKEKVMWLSFIEEIIINEVLKTHEGYDGRYDLFEGYSEDKLSVTLIVSSPYDRLYTAYLKMKIDEENGETTRCNNSAALYNNYMSEFKKYYNKTHMPIDATRKVMTMPNNAPMGNGLSDAEYENLKKDMTYILTEYFSSALSDDKVSDVVNKYMQNNIEMLTGNITKKVQEMVQEMGKKAFVKKTTITLLKSAWIGGNREYYQVVEMPKDSVTPNSQLDLQITDEQMKIFSEKEISFLVVNKGGTVTVKCYGVKPTQDYDVQVSIMEVEFI